MNAAELRSALRNLNLSQSGGARLLGVDARTMRRWCSADSASASEVPPPVARFLWFMQVSGAVPAEVMKALTPFLLAETAL